MRKYNLYLNARKKPRDDNQYALGKMGLRDVNTGKYQIKLNNDGIVPCRFIGQTNSRSTDYTTEVDIRGWADN